jgi:hypothetical protein
MKDLLQKLKCLLKLHKNVFVVDAWEEDPSGITAVVIRSHQECAYCHKWVQW